MGAGPRPGTHLGSLGSWSEPGRLRCTCQEVLEGDHGEETTERVS